MQTEKRYSGEWTRDVVVQVTIHGPPVSVGTTREAAILLLSAWPEARSVSHLAAVATCRDVLMGRACPSLSRSEFIVAALDAGLYVGLETFLDDLGSGMRDYPIATYHAEDAHLEAGMQRPAAPLQSATLWDWRICLAVIFLPLRHVFHGLKRRPLL